MLTHTYVRLLGLKPRLGLIPAKTLRPGSVYKMSYDVRTIAMASDLEKLPLCMFEWYQPGRTI